MHWRNPIGSETSCVSWRNYIRNYISFKQFQIEKYHTAFYKVDQASQRSQKAMITCPGEYYNLYLFSRDIEVALIFNVVEFTSHYNIDSGDSHLEVMTWQYTFNKKQERQSSETITLRNTAIHDQGPKFCEWRECVQSQDALQRVPGARGIITKSSLANTRIDSRNFEQ